MRATTAARPTVPPPATQADRLTGRLTTRIVTGRPGLGSGSKLLRLGRRPAAGRHGRRRVARDRRAAPGAAAAAPRPSPSLLELELHWHAASAANASESARPEAQAGHSDWHWAAAVPTPPRPVSRVPANSESESESVAAFNFKFERQARVLRRPRWKAGPAGGGCRGRHAGCGLHHRDGQRDGPAAST